jgi:hypothetical protein
VHARVIYRSNLVAPDLTANFKHTTCRVMPHSLGHDLLSDFADKADDDPVFGIHKRCSFLSHDEAAILYHCAQQAQGTWADIGCHTGWTTSHISAALDEPVKNVVAIDPALEDARFATRFMANCPHLITSAFMFEGKSQDWIANWMGHKYLSGAMIDGNHDDPEPLKDAQGCAAICLPDACIVFHDLLGKPIQDAVVWLLDNGWSAQVYYTPHMMAVAYRGGFNPPDHVRDPAIDWSFVRRNMPTFPFPFEECS